MKSFFSILSVFAILFGIVFIVGGTWGAYFTYTNIAREKIITPDDASIPGVPVRGPLTLMSQADIIRHHMLNTSGGLTYAEMPRQIPQVDENGNLILDENGEQVMVANTARNTWITATSLITALNLALLSYAFFGLMIFTGALSLWGGLAFRFLNKRAL